MCLIEWKYAAAAAAGYVDKSVVDDEIEFRLNWTWSQWQTKGKISQDASQLRPAVHRWGTSEQILLHHQRQFNSARQCLLGLQQNAIGTGHGPSGALIDWLWSLDVLHIVKELFYNAYTLDLTFKGCMKTKIGFLNVKTSFGVYFYNGQRNTTNLTLNSAIPWENENIENLQFD